MALFKKNRKEQDTLAKDDRTPLADKLIDWPLLRLLLLHRGFRWVVILFLLSVIALALLLPKVWVATPEGFRPQIKISLLDRLQSWNLKRQALAHLRNNQPEAAVKAWRAAWANDPGSAEALRGLLDAIAKTDHPQDHVNIALQGASWLLRMENTNRVDVPLIAWTWIRSGLSERALPVLDLAPQPMPEKLQLMKRIALFEAGLVRDFALATQTPEWQQRINDALDAMPENPSDPVEREFRLVALAWLAGWAPESERRAQALDQLRKAQQNLATEAVAYDLEYIVHLAHRDSVACRTLLAKLQEVGKDTVRHHTSFWRLLATEGRRPEAVELARRSNLVPTSAWDAYQLARTYTLLGMLDQANELLRGYSRNIGWLAESLVLRGDVLMRQAGIVPDPNWDTQTAVATHDPLEELTSLALTIRIQPAAMDVLGGYSYYLEGIAEWYRGNKDAAGQVFAQAGKIGFRDPALGLQVAKHLLGLGGAARWAEPILLSLQDRLGDDPDYLLQLIKCASQLREDRYLLAPAKRMYELKPDDPVAMNNYAAALMIVRERPEEAIALSLQLLSRFPDVAELWINHSIACSMNNRGEDAVLALTHVDPARLEPPERAQYYMARFEANWLVGRLKVAWESLKQVDRSYLYPAQLSWLARVEPKFEADLEAAGLKK